VFRRIVLALDGTASGDVAMSFAMATAADQACAVHVVHVNEYLVGGNGLTLRPRAEAVELVRAAVAAFDAVGVPASGSVRVAKYCDVGAAVAEVAREVEADAILVGSHRRRAVKRFFASGVREQTARHSVLPILTAPAPLDIPNNGFELTGSLIVDH
jgi:nucleotide-binding universal stress UspA family protein